MRDDFDGHRDVWGPLLALQLRAWSAGLFAPASALRDLGLFRPERLGEPPAVRCVRGGGPKVATEAFALSLLDPEPAEAARLAEFDAAALGYRSAVEPFSAPIFAEVQARLSPFLSPDARILDAAAGPGTEAVQLARLVPDGEVVACDLSRPMVEAAATAVRDEGLRHVACAQVDVADLPRAWDGHFDAVVCQLSFHLLQDGEAAVAEFFRVLAPRGVLMVADPGPSWFNDLVAPAMAHASRAFVRYRTGPEFVDLFRQAGFPSPSWEEVLPGIGIALAVKPDDRP